MNTFASLRIRRSARGRHPQRGSVLIEFLIVFPIAMAMLLIVADFGRLTPWAQQVAYAADAGAQFAYRRYSCDGSCDGTGYRVDDPDPNAETQSMNFDPTVKGEIEDHIKSAVDGLVDWENDPVEIEVTEIRDCFRLTLLPDNIVELTPLEGSCGDEERRFIEIEVTSVFQPFWHPLKLLFMEVSLPEELLTWTFTVRRQIFPAS